MIVSVQPNNPDAPFAPTLRRYDARTGTPLGPAVRVSREPGKFAPIVPFRRDRLLFSGADATFTVDARTFRARRRVSGGAFQTGLAPDGHTAAFGTEDGSISIVDLRTGERRTFSGRHEDRVHGVHFTPDGRTLATRGDDGKVLVWDVRSGKVRETLTGHTSSVTTLVVADDGRTLYTGGLDGRVIVWDIAGDRRLAQPFQASPPHPSGLSEFPPPPFAIGPSGRTVAAGLPDGGVRLHDARSLRRLGDLPGIEDGEVLAIEFSPDGRAYGVAGEDGTVEVRDVATGQRVRPALRGLGEPVKAMAFSPDGRQLAIADFAGSLRVTDLETGAVRRPPRLEGFPTGISFSPDGRTLAIADVGHGTQLRDSRSLEVVGHLRNAAGDEDRWARFSPDGRLLAVSALGYTQVWDVARRRPVGPRLRDHEFEVFNAEFSPDGRMLATSAFDGKVNLWDVGSRRSLGTLPGVLGPASVRFTPDGRHLFVLDDTGTGQRWEVSPDAWSRHACRVAGRDLTRAEWEQLIPGQSYRRVCYQERVD